MLHTLSPLKTYGERRGTEEFRFEASATLAHGCKQQGLNGCTGDFGHYYLLASTSPKTAIDFIRELSGSILPNCSLLLSLYRYSKCINETKEFPLVSPEGSLEKLKKGPLKKFKMVPLQGILTRIGSLQKLQKDPLVRISYKEFNSCEGSLKNSWKDPLLRIPDKGCLLRIPL